MHIYLFVRCQQTTRARARWVLTASGQGSQLRSREGAAVIHEKPPCSQTHQGVPGPRLCLSGDLWILAPLCGDVFGTVECWIRVCCGKTIFKVFCKWKNVLEILAGEKKEKCCSGEGTRRQPEPFFQRGCATNLGSTYYYCLLLNKLKSIILIQT